MTLFRLFNISFLQENNAQFNIVFIMATVILVPVLLSFWPARWIESWDFTQPQKLNTVTNGYIQTAAITSARYPGTCKRFLSEALAKKDRISGEENMSHPLISLKELQPISMKVKLTFKARLFDCLQNNCFWTIEVIFVPHLFLDVCEQTFQCREPST